MLIDVTSEGIKTEYIYLKSAKNGTEVFDLTKKENQQKKMKTLKAIKEQIQENSKTGSSINDIIKSIAKESNVKEEIVQNAINKVSDKMSSSNNLKFDNINLSTPYYITSLDLVNFCAYRKETFDFSKGLNVFIGATSSGKTTCFRAFKWIYGDDGNSKRFIKKGEDYCEATIRTSHNFTITRFINPKGKKTKDGKTVKNGYEITYPDGSIEVTNTKGVEIVKDILSYKKLDLESKEIDLNFLQQGSSWFFIGDKYTSTDKAKLIGAIHKTHFVDLVIKDLEAENKRFNQKREDKIEEISKIEKKLDNYSYLEDIRLSLDAINEKKTKLLELIEKRDRLSEILKKRNLLENQINDCEKTIEHIDLSNLNKSKQIIRNTRQNIEKYLKLEGIIEKENSILENIDITNKIMQNIDLSVLNKSKEKLYRAKDQLNLHSKINELHIKQYNIYKEIDKTNKSLDEINSINIEKSREIIGSLKSKISLKLTLESIIEKQKIIASHGMNMNSEINRYNVIMKKEIKAYEDLLLLNKRCPTCNSEIDAKMVIKNKLQKRSMEI